MTKEIIDSQPKQYADISQSLALVHQGKKIIQLDMDNYKPDTLESVVAKPFETAATNKERALSLAVAMDEAVQLARDSHLNPRDIHAALDTQRPVIDESVAKSKVQNEVPVEVSPFTALRDTILRVVGRGSQEDEPELTDSTDRLKDATDGWREIIAQRREALEVLKEGLDGVYKEAELALARRTAAQAGVTARQHQQVFVDRHAQTETRIGSATELLIGHVVDAKQKEATLDAVKDLRNQLSPEYFRITKYLRDQAAREDQLLERRADEEDAIAKLEAQSREIAQNIVALKRTEPDMNDSSSPHFEEASEDAGALDILIPDVAPEAHQLDAADRLTIEKTRLVSEAEDKLSACNDQLGRHRRNLVNVDAELNDIREQIPDFVAREAEMRRIILEDLVAPTILATTPEIQSVLQKFNEMRTRQQAQFDQLPKLVRDYAEAELWFNYEFAPQAIAQLKKMDPERYADFVSTEAQDGPVATAQVRRFMSLLGIIVLNRKDTFSTRVFQATQDYGTNVAQLAYDHASDGAENNVQMMLDSSSIAYTNATERTRLVEENSELGIELGRAIQDLDSYAKDVERAIDRADVKLQAVGFSMRTEYTYAQEVEAIWQDYQDAQAATTAELAKAEAAEAEQRRLEEARKSETRRLAGLDSMPHSDEMGDMSSDNYYQALQSGVVALSAEATAKTHAILANKLYESAWKKYEDLNAQSETTATLMRELYEARIAVLNELVQGAECGQEVLENAYAAVEKTIHIHDNLPIPGTLGESEIHRKFLVANGREALQAGEKPAPVGYIEKAKRRGIAAIEWAKSNIK